MKSARSRFTGLRFRVAFFFAFSIIIYIWLVYYCHFYCINNKYFGHKIRKSRSLKSHDDHPQSNILFCKIGKSIRTYYVWYLWWERKSAGSFFIWVIFFWWSISSLDNRYNKVTTLHNTSDCVFALLFFAPFWFVCVSLNVFDSIVNRQKCRECACDCIQVCGLCHARLYIFQFAWKRFQL